MDLSSNFGNPPAEPEDCPLDYESQPDHGTEMR